MVKKIYVKILTGALSGFLSGLFIGIILFLADAFPKIVLKFGAKNELVAFSIHMFAGIVMGTLFGILFYEKIKSLKFSILFASIFSLVFWLLATLIVKPLRFGGSFLDAFIGVFQSLNIFFGHIIFGIVLGLAFFYSKKKIKFRKCS